MGLADGFRDSDYLIKYYLESAQALWAYDHDDNVKALRKAASLICKALTRLSGDKSFWDELAALRGPVTQNERAIRQALDELDLFLTQERQVLREYDIPEGVIKKILSDLNVSLKTFRGNPDAQLLNQLRQDVPEAAETMCAVSKYSLENAQDGKILGIGLRTSEGLGVLGGVTTIVVNGVTSTAMPIALWSIVGGAASSLGFLAWLKHKKG